MLAFMRADLMSESMLVNWLNMRTLWFPCLAAMSSSRSLVILLDASSAEMSMSGSRRRRSVAAWRSLRRTVSICR